MHRLSLAAAASFVAVLGPAGAHARIPGTTPNTVKYKDAGAKPVRVTSGGLEMRARALLGKDGVTTIEARTGDFEAGATTGVITGAQLLARKPLDPNGVDQGVAFLRNFAPLSTATFSTSTSALAHGQQVEITARLAGATTPVTQVDVDTGLFQVKLRPDLTASAPAAPPKGLTGVPMFIAATVSELNGEVGAHADCVLWADGVEMDRARAIWVDAGGNVTCTFRATFVQKGRKSLQVAVESVAPGDYDASNNIGPAVAVDIYDLKPLLSGAGDFSITEFMQGRQQIDVTAFDLSRLTTWGPSYSDQVNESFVGELQERSGEQLAVAAAFSSTPIQDGALLHSAWTTDDGATMSALDTQLAYGSIDLQVSQDLAAALGVDLSGLAGSLPFDGLPCGGNVSVSFESGVAMTLACDLSQLPPGVLGIPEGIALPSTLVMNVFGKAGVNYFARGFDHFVETVTWDDSTTTYANDSNVDSYFAMDLGAAGAAWVNGGSASFHFSSQQGYDLVQMDKTVPLATLLDLHLASTDGTPACYDDSGGQPSYAAQALSGLVLLDPTGAKLCVTGTFEESFKLGLHLSGSSITQYLTPDLIDQANQMYGGPVITVE